MLDLPKVLGINDPNAQQIGTLTNQTGYVKVRATETHPLKLDKRRREEMTPLEMMRAAVEAKSAGRTMMTMVRRKPFKRPKGFPRGELICENHDGRNVYNFNVDRIIKWL